MFGLHGRMYTCAMTCLQISATGRGGGRRKEGRDFRLSAGVTTRVRTSKVQEGGERTVSSVCRSVYIWEG